MTEEKTTLSPDVLNAIEPFSGAPQREILQGGMAMQQTKTTYTTAISVQKPRSIAKVTKNILEEAKLAGASFYYRWEVKNKKTGRKSIVLGASIDLTMAIARNYGNCVVDIEVEETASHYLFKGVFIDLESGFTVPRLFRQRKSQNIGSGYGDERAEDIVFQIGQSKAQRNAIDKAAPGWLIDQAIEVARTAEINKVDPENLHIARAKVLDFFGTYGVTTERIEASLERPADDWTSENIADLRASATALKEGRIGPDELFPGKVKAEPDINIEFEAFVKTLSVDQAKVEAFIKETSEAHKMTVRAVKEEILEDKDSFKKALEKWVGDQGNEKEPEREQDGPDLLDRLKAMRPGTSTKNKTVFKKLVLDNLDEIRSWPAKDRDYMTLRWGQQFPDISLEEILAEIVPEDAKEEQSEKSITGNPDERPPNPPMFGDEAAGKPGGMTYNEPKDEPEHIPPWKRRKDFLDAMKDLYDKNREVYYNTLAEHNYEKADDVPAEADIEIEILTIMKEEIPGV